MANAVRSRFVAECFWAGVREQDLRELDRRIVAELGPPVRYLGRLLVFDDEVVLIVLEGPVDAVRVVAERADIPFERLLGVSYAPWPVPIADEEETQ